MFSLALAAFLLAPLLIKRAGLPGIVGIVLVGAAVGPGGFGLLGRHDAIVLLGEVGLIYLLFTVGMELDLQGFRRSPHSAALFGLASFGIPFVVGSVGGVVLLGLEPLASLLLAAVYASHTLLAYPVVNRLGVGRNDAVTAVFGGILFTDTIALVVLALVLGTADGQLGPGLLIDVTLSLLILFGVVWLILPRVGRWFFRVFSQESYFEFLFVVTAFFLAASLAELLALAGILGAFIAGLALNRLIVKGGPLHNRLEFAGNALFIPFFLFYVGTLVEFGVLVRGPRTLLVAAFIVGVMLATKWIAAWLVARLQQYSAAERTVIFGLSTGQAAAALAITLLGYEAGLFDTAVLNAVVLMLLLTAIVSPWVTERGARAVAANQETDTDGPAAREPRLLVPLSHGAELQRRLLELALVLTGESAHEPVHVLTVVQPGPPGTTDDRIDEAHEALETLRPIGSAAEVPIETETRVNHNVASGIAQAAVEERTTLVVMGWDAGRSLRHLMFGSVIDDVLGQLTQPVLVARLGHPINTTRRLYLVLPAGIHHHAGYFESIHLYERLADRLGVDVTTIAVDRDPGPYAESFGQVDPAIESAVTAVPDWDDALAHLAGELDPDDLVGAIVPEPRGVGWDDALAHLPERLADLPPHSFVVLHPREGQAGYDRQYLRMD